MVVISRLFHLLHLSEPPKKCPDTGDIVAITHDDDAQLVDSEEVVCRSLNQNTLLYCPKDNQ